MNVIDELESAIHKETDIEMLRRLALIALDAWRAADTGMERIKTVVELSR